MDKQIMEMEKAFGALNSKLREQLIDTKLVTIQQWNTEIAPAMSNVAKAIEGYSLTARTYILPTNYFED